MAILKLVNGRENAISGTITAMELDETGRFGTQYKVTMGDDVMWLNKEHCDRQFTRLGKEPDAMIGEAVTIWKKPMDGDPVKGFLNIELGTWGAKSSAVALAVHTDDYVGRDLRARGVTIVPKLTLDEIVDRYAACLGKAHALVADYKESLGVELPPEAVTSVAATLFIESRKAGV